MTAWFKVLWLFATGKRREGRSLMILKIQRLLKRYYSLRRNTGIFIMKEAWDYLIILDACRYDYFAKEYQKFLHGDLLKRRSRGSSTSDWLLKNFNGSRHSDTVYVSGNPHCSDKKVNGFLGTDHFHAVEHVWKYAWDESVDSIRPEDMVKAALDARHRHSGKRIVIHFIQPHGPWIGDTKISMSALENPQVQGAGVDGKWTVDKQIWELVRQGVFDVDRLKKAYTDNLVMVLRSVRDLVDALDGRIVVSADHGEAFGDRIVVEHPSGVYCKELVEIPWLVINKAKSAPLSPSHERDQGGVERSGDVSDEVVAKRLRALGYID